MAKKVKTAEPKKSEKTAPKAEKAKKVKAAEPAAPKVKAAPLLDVDAGTKLYYGEVVGISTGGYGIVIPKGTYAALEVKSASPSYASAAKAREQLIADGTLKKNGKGYVFTDDYPFLSRTTAARVISGTVIDGKFCWKLEPKKTAE